MQVQRRITTAVLAVMCSFGTFTGTAYLAATPVELQALSNITVTGGPAGSIVIEFAEQSKDVTIMRATESDGKYTKVATVKSGKTSYVDGVEEGTYFYKVLLGNEKEADAEVYQATAGDKSTLFSGEESAKKFVQEQMDNHIGEFTIYYRGYKEGMCDNFYTANEDDTVNADVSYYEKLGDDKVYKITYTVTYGLTKEEETAVNEEVDRLLDNELSGLENATTADKVKRIFTYLTTNVVEAQEGSESSVYTVLINKQGDAVSTAKTMQKLLNKFGVENKLEDGWNLVRMADGAWYDVDVFRQIQSIELIEYNNYSYLLTPRLDEHETEDSGTQPAEAWNFNKVEPTNITAYTSDEGLIITWDRVDHADGYRVQRATEKDGAYSDVISYDGQEKDDRGYTTTNEIVDSTAEEGVTYYYRVKAYSNYKGEKDEGSYSDPQRVTYLGNISLSISVNSFSPLLSWQSVDGADSYNVYRKAAGEKEELIANVSGNMFTDHNANTNGNYSYRIQVVRATTSGEMPEYYSNYATTYGINAINTTETGIQVEWKSQSDTDRFRVYRYDEKAKAFSLVYVSEPGETSYLDEFEYKTGKTYTYQIAPFVEGQTGRDINTKAAAKSGIALGTPQVGGTRINDVPMISWSSVTGATGYEVYIVNENGEDTLYGTYSCAENTAFLTDLKDKTSIQVKIVAVNLTGGAGAASNTIEL
jgi:hypothetical protein